jgi:NADH dehydrogenase FAD-containing subunit
MAEKIRVLILGGGFGGLYAALQFEKRNDPGFEATVVNRENFFCSRRCCMRSLLATVKFFNEIIRSISADRAI